jgi:hypothetical protein
MPFDPLVQKVLKIISVANSLNITHLAHLFLTQLTSFFMTIGFLGAHCDAESTFQITIMPIMGFYTSAFDISIGSLV